MVFLLSYANMKYINFGVKKFCTPGINPLKNDVLTFLYIAGFNLLIFHSEF